MAPSETGARERRCVGWEGDQTPVPFQPSFLPSIAVEAARGGAGKANSALCFPFWSVCVCVCVFIITWVSLF